MSKNTPIVPPVAPVTLVPNPALKSVLARAAMLASKPRKGKKGNPKTCICGCGDQTKGGDWMPGHDSKFTSIVIRLMREKGITDIEAAPLAYAERAAVTAAEKVKVAA